MQVESRVILFTMPRRRRFKPRIDCVAILGKLSSAIVRWFTHKPNTYCPGLKSRLCRLCLHSSSNPSFDKGGACCTFSKCELRSGYFMFHLGVKGSFCVIPGALYLKLIKRSMFIFLLFAFKFVSLTYQTHRLVHPRVEVLGCDLLLNLYL